MDIQIATLCDSAMDYNGKLCVLGTFDTIGARALPVVHAQAALALRFCFRAIDEGEHDFVIRFIDADGNNAVQPIEAQFDVKVPEGVDFMTKNMILNFQQLRFEKPGSYSIDILIDDDVLCSLPLRVVVVEAPQQAQA